MNKRELLTGAKAATPIVLGYLPVCFAFGVLARRAGLTPFEVGLMSLLVYAGSSQFVAVEMISKGLSWFPIVVTTFLINLRHFLMSSTLSPYFCKQPLRILGFLAAELTDESFVVAMSDLSMIAHRPEYVMGLQLTSHLAWLVGSLGGALFGQLIDYGGYGLPFALPSLFISLLVLQIKNRLQFGVALLAGVLSLLFKWMFPGSWHVVLAALLGSGVGATVEAIRRKA